VVIAWGDGQSDTINLAAGVTTIPGTSHTYRNNLAGDAAYTIGVTVTDSDSATATGSASVVVSNVAPSVQPIAGPATGVRAQSLDFVDPFSDPGNLDTHLAVVDWGDGTTSAGVVSESNGSGSVSASHVYLASGNYTVKFTVTDSDSAATSVSRQVSIVAAGLQPDPLDPTKTSLFVGGTTGTDVVTILPATKGRVTVIHSGGSVDVFAPTGSIVVFGGNGNDVISVSPAIRLPAFLFGGDGNDVLIGGAGDSVLVGGNGSNVLIGGQGRNILIGGDGADKYNRQNVLIAGSGADLMVAGSTDHDAQLTALAGLLSEWSRTDADYGTRVGHLRGTLAGGKNGAFLLNASTVHANAVRDFLYGGLGQNWYVAHVSGSGPQDLVIGGRKTEFVDSI
jgi:Ca2+-binding RTX toxin-like protein